MQLNSTIQLPSDLIELFASRRSLELDSGSNEDVAVVVVVVELAKCPFDVLVLVLLFVGSQAKSWRSHARQQRSH